MGVLSWLVEEGNADGVDLSGLPVAMAIRYSDDEPGSPWSWIMYLDAHAAAERNAKLEAIFTGTLGGDGPPLKLPTCHDGKAISPTCRVLAETGGTTSVSSQNLRRTEPVHSVYVTACSMGKKTTGK